jgi:hypothetical protein
MQLAGLVSMGRFRTGKRNKLRAKMVVPVRVRLSGTGTSMQLAHTLDATERGVRLAGFRGEVNPGDVLDVQYGTKRGLFRVVWVRKLEKSSEKHLGAECVEPDKNIWDIDFPQLADEYEEHDL